MTYTEPLDIDDSGYNLRTKDPDCRRHTKVGEGEILLVQPRHPDILKEGYASGPLGKDWDGEKADNLTGILHRWFFLFFLA